MCLVSTDAVLAGLAVAVAGFNDAYVVVDPNFEVFGPQGSSVKLLQELRHTCQEIKLITSLDHDAIYLNVKKTVAFTRNSALIMDKNT